MAKADYDAKFLARLLDIFKGEAREHIDEMSSRLREIELGGDGDALVAAVETAFREAHSLKAAAQAVGRAEIATICQSMESVFSAFKSGETAPIPVLLDALHRANDGLNDYLAAVDAPSTAEQRQRAAALVAALDHALTGGAAPIMESEAPSDGPVMPDAAPAVATAAAAAQAAVAPPVARSPTEALPPQSESPADRAPVAEERPVLPEPPPPIPRLLEPAAPLPIPQTADVTPAPPAAAQQAPATIRLAVRRIESLMLEAEGMILSKLAARERASALSDSAAAYAEWTDEWHKAQGASHALRQLIRTDAETDPATQAMKTVLRFLDWNESSVRAMEAALLQNSRAAQIEARSLGSNVDRLLQGVKHVLMQQCATMLQTFPRAVRDLARDQGKAVELVLAGTTLEVDRRILDALREPLLHLVRNCVDHGVEKPESRAAAGKPPTATVKIAASQKDSDKVEFVVSDDGAGIATEKVVAAAVKQGILRPDQVASLSEDERLSLIFRSGVSTSPLITDISGRGLGMAIVAEAVENLGGSIAVRSRPGEGTTFHLIVPLTLATFRGVCVRVSDQIFVIPTLALNRVVSAERTALATIENRPVLTIDGTPVMLVALRDVLEMSDASVVLPTSKLFAVVLGAADRRVAFEVDEILGDQEILIKPLGRYLVRVPNVLGAAVLGSGKVAPVLNAHDLLKSAAHAATAPRVDETVPSEASPANDKAILVVEDSITARSLLKNIFEAAGYHVMTAVDGLDAWSAIKLEQFQLVVSDVEMPRMNGFDLTRRIRADRNLAELPVLLLTALESREDRERGVEAGANAYIVKSDFDQERLLEVVARLI